MPYMEEQAYKDALAFNPDIVTIKLGTNDSKPYNWENKANFKDDLKFMINSFRELPANPDIWLCLPEKDFINFCSHDFHGIRFCSKGSEHSSDV